MITAMLWKQIITNETPPPVLLPHRRTGLFIEIYSHHKRKVTHITEQDMTFRVDF